MKEVNAPLGGAEKLTIWTRNYMCIFIAQAFMSLSNSSVNTLVVRYARDALGVGDVLIGMLAGLFYAVAIACRPVAGPMQTKLDKRKLLLFVYATGGIVNLGYALFNTTAAFVTFRILQGVQYSFMGSLSLTIAADSVPKEKMASAIAIYGVGGAVSQALGPNIGMWLRNLGPTLRDGAEGIALGYQLAFFFAAAILVIAAIPVFMLSFPKQAKEKMATTGAWYKNIISIHAAPMTIVMFFAMMAYSVYNNYLDAFAEERGILGINMFFTVSAVVMIVTRPVSGTLVEKLGMKRVLPTGMVLIGISLLLVGNSTGLPLILVGAFFAALGFGTMQPGLQAVCLQSETKLKRAVASNTLFTGIDLGSFVGPLVSGIVVARSNYATVMLAALVPLALALILFFVFLPGYTKRVNEIEALGE